MRQLFAHINYEYYSCYNLNKKRAIISTVLVQIFPQFGDIERIIYFVYLLRFSKKDMGRNPTLNTFSETL